MTLAQLSRECGISVRKLDYWEMGRMAIDMISLVRIASALKVSPGRLTTSNHLSGDQREALHRAWEIIYEIAFAP